MAAASSSCCASLKLHFEGIGRERSLRRRGSDHHPPPSRVNLPWIQRRPTMKAALTASPPAGENTPPPIHSENMKTETMQEAKQGLRRRSTRSRDFIVSQERIEQWVYMSIAKIVKNMGETPLLVRIYAGGDGGSSSGMLSMETQKVTPEDWMKIKDKWDEEDCRPDAIILVEELGPLLGDDEETAVSSSSLLSPPPPDHRDSTSLDIIPSRGRYEHRRSGGGATASSSSTRKTLGLVVQGGGAANCYILDTTRVESSFGFCTYFCLIRARLGEPYDVQLKKTWLV